MKHHARERDEVQARQHFGQALVIAREAAEATGPRATLGVDCSVRLSSTTAVGFGARPSAMRRSAQVMHCANTPP